MGELILKQNQNTNAINAIVRAVEHTEEYVPKLCSPIQQIVDLEHPNVWPCFVDPMSHRLVWQPYSGLSLAQIVRRHAFVLSDFIELAQGVLSAMVQAHSLGIKHGSLCGDSVIVTEDACGGYQVQVRGFDAGYGNRGEANEDESQGCIAPEILKGEEIQESSDLYSIGALLYFCLCGRYPNEGVSSIASRNKIVEQQTLSISLYRKDLPAELVNWVMNLCNENVRLRPSSCLSALEKLNEFQLSPDIAYAPYASEDVVDGVYARQMSRDSLALKPLEDQSGSIALFASPQSIREPESSEQTRNHILASIGKKAGSASAVRLMAKRFRSSERRSVMLALLGIVGISSLLFLKMGGLSELGIRETVDVICESVSVCGPLR